MCGPHGGPGGGAPKRQIHENFKHLLLQIQKENSQAYTVGTCRCHSLDQEFKLCSWQFPECPEGPLMGYIVKSNCFIFFLRIAWLDFKKTIAKKHLRGRGFKVVHMVHVAPMGGPRAKTLQIANFFLQIQLSRIL